MDNVDPSTIESFESAREVFKAGHFHLLKAKEYIVLDGYVTEHIGILRNISSLYKYLACFESDPKRILAMHLRRTALLVSIPEQLNPSIYCGLIKELTYELGETFHEIALVKEGQLSTKEKLKASDRSKYNEYALNSIKYFKMFIQQYSTEDDLPPSTIDLDELGPFLRAHFYIARLYGRQLLPDRHDQVASLKQSLHVYENVVRLEHKYMLKLSKEQRRQVRIDQELEICREMSELIPRKIDNIIRSSTA